MLAAGSTRKFCWTISSGLTFKSLVRVSGCRQSKVVASGARPLDRAVPKAAIKPLAAGLALGNGPGFRT
jgi:hypothetical protein